MCTPHLITSKSIYLIYYTVPSDIPDLSNPNKKKTNLSELSASTSRGAVEEIGPALPTDDDGIPDTRME